MFFMALVFWFAPLSLVVLSIVLTIAEKYWQNSRCKVIVPAASLVCVSETLWNLLEDDVSKVFLLQFDKAY